MEPWIDNIPLYGQSGSPVYRQLRAFSKPGYATQGHASTSNYRSFGLPFQHQTGVAVYHSASSYQNQSDYSKFSSPSKPSASSSGNDRTETGKEKKMWLKELKGRKGKEDKKPQKLQEIHN